MSDTCFVPRGMRAYARPHEGTFPEMDSDEIRNQELGKIVGIAGSAAATEAVLHGAAHVLERRAASATVSAFGSAALGLGARALPVVGQAILAYEVMLAAKHTFEGLKNAAHADSAWSQMFPDHREQPGGDSMYATDFGSGVYAVLAGYSPAQIEQLEKFTTQGFRDAVAQTRFNQHENPELYREISERVQEVDQKWHRGFVATLRGRIVGGDSTVQRGMADARSHLTSGEEVGHLLRDTAVAYGAEGFEDGRRGAVDQQRYRLDPMYRDGVDEARELGSLGGEALLTRRAKEIETERQRAFENPGVRACGVRG